ncbi:MAG: PilZ domain-containing protein [Planctomycetes bacterium]|nr:PilZ domain-containing protein [Planctomycetota bacterium]
MSDEKRRKPRFDAENVFAAITVVGGCDQGFGVITNVSEGGVCLRTPMPPPTSGKVILRISVDNTTHEVQALVRRVSEASGAMYDCGLQFAPNDPGKEAFVEAFLAEQSRH